MKTTKSGKVVLNKIDTYFYQIYEADKALKEANKQIRQIPSYGLFRLFSVLLVLVFMYLLVLFVGIVVGVNMTPQKKEIHIKYASVCTLPATGVDASGYR